MQQGGEVVVSGERGKPVGCQQSSGVEEKVRQKEKGESCISGDIAEGGRRDCGGRLQVVWL